jgi:hypothetical protein
VFAEVRDLSVEIVEFGGESQVISVFPGPHLLPLLDTDVVLDAKKVSQTLAYLTSNRNAVAAEVAACSGDQGIKTLIFTQTIPFCSSVQKNVSKTMKHPKSPLNVDERRQYAHAQ